MKFQKIHLLILSLGFISAISCQKVAKDTPDCIVGRIRQTSCLSAIEEYLFNGQIVYLFKIDNGGGCYQEQCEYVLSSECGTVFDSNGNSVCTCSSPFHPANNCITFLAEAKFRRKIWSHSIFSYHFK